MTITATSLCNYVNIEGNKLVTMQARYGRTIHAEVLTHRIISIDPEIIEITSPDGVMYDTNLSRNASSSRAIPIPRLIQSIIDDPAEPIHWGSHQKGMQAGAELTGETLEKVKAIYRRNRQTSINDALEMHELGAAKQLVNRLVEKHGHITTLITATEYQNFFDLRLHKDAQPEIQELARVMKIAYDKQPILLHPGQWSIPYVTVKDIEAKQAEEASLSGKTDYYIDAMINWLKVSAARCARTSYFTHEGKQTSLEADIKLCDILYSGRHMSPFEHIATPDIHTSKGWSFPQYHGNFTGFIQLRKILELNDWFTVKKISMTLLGRNYETVNV